MLKKLAAFFMSAVLYILVFAMAGIGLLVFGVYVIAGLGWAMIASGFILILAACLIALGLRPNG
jgi:hypothetical protein